MIDPIRGSVWKSKINSFLALMFVGTCALWAALFIMQSTWGINPLTNAFAKMVQAQTQITEIP